MPIWRAAPLLYGAPRPPPPRPIGPVRTRAPHSSTMLPPPGSRRRRCCGRCWGFGGGRPPSRITAPLQHTEAAIRPDARC